MMEEVEESLTLDIMMLLDTDKVPALREEFEKKEDGLTEAEFVFVMKKYIKSSVDQVKLVSNLCELFAQIDVNGDGSMEWDEFTSYIVDTGNVARENEPNNIQSYQQRPWVDEDTHAGGIHKVFYFPKIDKVASCSNECNYLYFYNPETFRPEKPLYHRTGYIQTALHIGTRNQIALSATDLTISLYDDQNYRFINKFQTDTSQTCLEWSTEGLFSGGINGVVHLWDIDTGKEVLSLGGINSNGYLNPGSHRDMILDLLEIGSLESLASGSMDKTIKLWDLYTGKHKKTLEGHKKGVRSLAYNVDYRFMVSAGFDYDALVWNPYVEHLILRLHGHTAPLCKVEMIPDTPQIITADITGTLKVWDIRNFACMQTMTADPPQEISDFTSVHRMKSLMVGGKQMHLFDYEKLTNPQMTDDLPLFAAFYNPTTMTFITASGRDIKLWDARHGTLIKRFRGLSSVSSLSALCLDDRERKFIIGQHDGSIVVCDYVNGSEMKRFAYPETSHRSEVSALLYCNQFKVVISAGWDDTIIIHEEMDAEKGIMLRKMTGGHFGGDVTSLAYSYNLSLIASGSSSPVAPVVLWDFEFGRVEAILHPGADNKLCTCTALVFIDEAFPGLVSADSTGSLVFWCVRPAAHLRNEVVAKVTNRVDHVATGVTVMQVDQVHCLLYTGDEHGNITVWDFAALTEKMVNLMGRNFKNVECENPRRNIRVDVQNNCKHEKRKSISNSVSGGARTVFAVSTWQAHSDAIQSMQLVLECNHECIITSSFDCLVKVFDLKGGVIGVLRQGENISGFNWNFKVDVNKRKSRQLDKAACVLENLEQVGDDFMKLLKDDSDEDSSGFISMNQSLEVDRFSERSSYERKTPRLKPIGASMAGRGFSNSLKGRRMRATTKK